MEMPEGLAAALAAAAGSAAVRAALALVIPAVSPQTRVSARPPLPLPLAESKEAEYARLYGMSPQRKLRTKRPAAEDRKRIRINLLFPYKGGTKAARTYEMMKECATVGDFRRRCHAEPDRYDIGYLNYAARDGNITIHNDGE